MCEQKTMYFTYFFKLCKTSSRLRACAAGRSTEQNTKVVAAVVWRNVQPRASSVRPARCLLPFLVRLTLAVRLLLAILGAEVLAEGRRVGEELPQGSGRRGSWPEGSCQGHTLERVCARARQRRLPEAVARKPWPPMHLDGDSERSGEGAGRG